MKNKGVSVLKNSLILITDGANLFDHVFISKYLAIFLCDRSEALEK
jgi:hypothetical protein